MKYYVYALDTRSKRITTALSCPDENTAQQAYQIAFREMEVENNEDRMGKFQFGNTSNSQVVDKFLVHLGDIDVQLKIDLTWLPDGSGIFRKGITPHRIFDIVEFESAESQTKKSCPISDTPNLTFNLCGMWNWF